MLQSAPRADAAGVRAVEHAERGGVVVAQAIARVVGRDGREIRGRCRGLVGDERPVGEAVAEGRTDANVHRACVAGVGRRDQAELRVEDAQHVVLVRVAGGVDVLQQLDLVEALVEEASKPPPPKRRKTRPSKGAVERRLKKKAGRSAIKKMRGRVKDD